MRILVIGGTAFIGREIVRRLTERGHEVSVLHRKDHHDLGAAVHNLRADRADLDAVRRYLREHAFQVVFDTAYGWERGTGADIVEGTARACPEDLHRYVFMSSIAVYASGSDRRENDPLAPNEGRRARNTPACRLPRVASAWLHPGAGGGDLTGSVAILSCAHGRGTSCVFRLRGSSTGITPRSPARSEDGDSRAVTFGTALAPLTRVLVRV